MTAPRIRIVEGKPLNGDETRRIFARLYAEREEARAVEHALHMVADVAEAIAAASTYDVRESLAASRRGLGRAALVALHRVRARWYRRMGE